MTAVALLTKCQSQSLQLKEGIATADDDMDTQAKPVSKILHYITLP